MDLERCMNNGTDNSILNIWQPVFETQANMLVNTPNEKEVCVHRCLYRVFWTRVIQFSEIIKCTDLITDTISENPHSCLLLERCSVQPSFVRALNLVVMLSCFSSKAVFLLGRDFLCPYFIIAVAFHSASQLFTVFTATKTVLQLQVLRVVRGPNYQTTRCHIFTRQ